MNKANATTHLFVFLRVLLILGMLLPAQPIQVASAAQIQTRPSPERVIMPESPSHVVGHNPEAQAVYEIEPEAGAQPIIVNAAEATLHPAMLETDAFERVTSDLNFDSDPSVILLADGRLMVAWSSYIQNDYEVLYKTSADNGVTWSEATNLTNNDLNEGAPSIFQTADSRIWAIYTSTLLNGQKNLYYKISEDNGITWSNETTLLYGGGGMDRPVIFQSADSRIWVAWSSYSNSNREIFAIHSTDNGVTWSAASVLVTGPWNANEPYFYQGTDGKLWLTWRAAGQGNSDIYAKTSTDNGATWSSNILLVSSPENDFEPAMAQGGDSKLWLTWTRSTYFGSQIIYKTSTDGGVNWSDEQVWTRYTGYNESFSPVKLANGVVAGCLASDRYFQYEIWFAAVGQTQDLNPPPHVGFEETSPGHPDDNDVFTIRAYVSDETGVSSVHLDWMVGDISQPQLDLFDDGQHNDNQAGDGWYGNAVGPFAAGSLVLYQIEVSDLDGNTITAPGANYYYGLNIVPQFVKTADILLVFDEGSYSSANGLIGYYTRALNNLGLAYDVWETRQRGEPLAEPLDLYANGVVIWAVPTSGYLNDARVQDALALMLDAGGKLLLTGQDVGYYIGDTSFYQSYLHTTYISDSARVYEIEGVAGDVIGDQLAFDLNGVEGAQNQYWIDVVEPIAPAITFLQFANPTASLTDMRPAGNEKELPEERFGYRLPEYYGKEQEQPIIDPLAPKPPHMPDDASEMAQSIGVLPEPQMLGSGTAGLRVDTGTYKVVYLPFGIEAIGQHSHRAQLLERAIAWLNAAPPRAVQNTPKNNGQYISGIGDPFTWLGVAGTASYQIQLDGVSTFDSASLIDQTVSETNYLPTLSTGKWFWRVRTLPDGQWSAPWEVTVISPAPDISVYKDYSNGTLKPGNQITYWLYWTNKGSQTAGDVQIADMLPDGLSYVSHTAELHTPGTSFPEIPVSQEGNKLTWNVGDVEPDWYGYIILTVAISQNAQPGSTIRNVVEAVPAAGELETENNTFTRTNTLLTPAPNLYTYTYLGWNSYNGLIPGYEYTYWINWGNNGDADATNVVITDTLPATLTYVSSSGAPVEPVVDNNTITWAIGDVPANSYGSLSLQVRVTDTAIPGQTITHRSSISAATGEIDLQDNQAFTENAILSPGPDLSISTYLPYPINTLIAGNEVEFYISFSNNGVTPAENAQVFYTLPAELSYISSTVVHQMPENSTSEGNPAITGNILSWDLGSLAPGAFGGISVRVRIAEETPVGTSLTLQASITTTENDLFLLNNSGTATYTTQAPVPEMYISSSVYSYEAIAGRDYNFGLSFGNDGYLAADDAVIYLTLPEGVSFVGSQGNWSTTENPPVIPEAVVNGSSVTWNLGDVGPKLNGNMSVTVHVAQDVPVGSMLHFEPEITVYPDELYTHNNRTNFDVTAQATGPDVFANMYLSSSISDFIAGKEVTYAIHFRNQGYNSADNIQAALTLPAELSYVSSSIDFYAPEYSSIEGTPTVDGNVLTWDLGNLVVGADGNIYVRIRIANETPVGTVLTTQASLTIPEDDLNLANNTTVVDYTTQPPLPEVYISSSLNQKVIAGRDFNYYLNFGNSGHLDANAAAIHFTLPDGVSFVSSQGSWSVGENPPPIPEAVLDGNSVTWNLGDHRKQTYGSITAVLHLSEEAVLDSVVHLDAEITTYPEELNKDNNKTSADTMVDIARPDMSVQVSYNYGNLYPGYNINYHISWRNYGQGVAKNVQIINTLPEGLSYVSSSGYSYMPEYNTTNWTAAVNGNTVVWNLGDIDQGWRGYIDVTLKISPDVVPDTNLVNTVSAPTVQNETYTNNNTSESTVTVLHPVADLYVSTSQDYYLFAGLPANTNIYWSNNGYGAAQETKLTQTITGPASFVSARLTYNNTPELNRDITPQINGSTLVYDLGDISVGQSGYISVQLLIDPAAEVGAVVKNEAVISSNSPESNTGNNTTSGESSVILPSPDLSVSQNSLGDLAADSEITYQISYQNNTWYHPAESTQLIDVLPAGITFRRAVWKPGNDSTKATEITPVIDGNKLTFDLGILPGRNSAGYYGSVYVIGFISAAVNPPGTPLTNRVEIHTPYESNPSNNVRELTETVLQPTRDLGVSFYRKNGLPVIGEQVEYQIHAGNNGNASMDDVKIVYTLPIHTTFVSSVDGANNSYPPDLIETGMDGRQVLTWNFGTLSGQYGFRYYDSIMVTIAVDDSTTEGELLEHQVDISGSQVEVPNNSNRDTLQETALVPLHQLEITKELVNYYSTRLPGEVITWRIYVKNTGNLPEKGLIVTDTLPEGITYDTTYSNQGSSGWTRVVDENTISLTKPSLAAQTSEYFYISGRINNNVPPTTELTNSAQVVSDALSTPVTASNTITVQGPEIEVTPTSIDLGVSFPGYPVIGSFIVKNIGEGTLQVTGIEAGVAQLAVEPTSFTLSAGQSKEVWVTLTPEQLGEFNSTLTVASNDYDTPTVSVAITSNVIEPPVITVDKTSIEASISAGQSQQQVLTIGNAGNSALDVALNVRTTKENYRKIKVAVLGATSDSSYQNNIVQSLQSTGNFTSVTFIDVSSQTPTLAELQAYDSVLVFSNNYFADTENLGNVLADYVDGGGGVVVMLFTLHYWYYLGGRFQQEDYYAIPPVSGGSSYFRPQLGEVDLPDHPVMEGITSFKFENNGYFVNPPLPNDSKIIARFTNDIPLAVEKRIDRNGVSHRRIDLNFVPFSNQVYSDGWKADTQGAQLMANALLYTGSASFVTLSEEQAKLGVDASMAVTVTMDAAGYNAGTYQATIEVTSNDPATPVESIPVTMTVGGTPLASITPASFNFGEVIIGQTAARQISVTNTGTSDLIISSVTSSNPSLTYAPVPLRVKPGQQENLTVTYQPTVVSSFAADITLETNDPASPSVIVTASGRGVEPPVITVNPTSLNETVASGATKDVPVAIHNTGDSTLSWSLASTPATPAQGYTLVSSKDANGPAFRWFDISQTGTKADMSNYYSEASDLPIGFNFPYYGQIYDTFAINRFGYIVLGSEYYGSGYSNTNLPNPSNPNNLIALIWDELYPRDGSVYYQTVGDNLIVQYTNYSWNYYNQRFTAQLILRKNGEIVMQYLSFDSGAPVKYVTVGIENANGSQGVQAVYNGSLLENQLALLFKPAASWHNVAPASGSTQPDASSTFTLHLNANGMPSGSYQGEVQASSNDPATPVVTVPFSMSVTGQPQIAAAPSSLLFGRVFAGHTKTAYLMIQNNGASPLTISGISSDNPAISVDQTSFTVPGYGWHALPVMYTPTTAETLAAALTITSDDPINPTFTVPLSGSSDHIPAAEISPASITANISTGKIETRTLALKNTGQGPLAFNITGNPYYYVVSPASGTVEPGGQAEITLTFDTMALATGQYSNPFTITTDDPQHPSFTIPVTVNVILGLPEAPANPLPEVDTQNTDINGSLRWDRSYHAAYYSLYLWPDGSPKPATPTASPIFYNYYYDQITYQPAKPLATNTTYHWQVVAVNVVGSTPGPEWTFTTEKLPELQVSAISLPARAYSGMPIEVSWVVTNSGDMGTTNWWYDHIYLSQSPLFSSDGLIHLGSVTNASYLDPGESYRNTSTFTLPNGLSGNYYIYVQTDGWGYIKEPVEDNNITRSGSSFTVSLTPPPDLQVTAVSGPENVFSGMNMQVGWTVRNAGQGGTVESRWYDQIYLSKDTVFNAQEDLYLGYTWRRGQLNSGETYSATAEVYLPHTLYGDFYLFVVTDASRYVYEYSAETNNTSSPSSVIHVTLTPPPDLEVTGLTVPSSAYSGDAIDVSWVVTNNGLGEPFEQSWVDRVYLSTSATFDPQMAAELGSRSTYGDLLAGADYSRNQQYYLPQGISGVYYVHVWTDASNNVFEYEFDNNNVKTSGPIKVTLSASPDLTVSNVTAPVSANAGDPVEVQWTVTNLKDATGSATWNDALYISTSPAASGGSTYLGSFSELKALATNEAYTQTRTVILPGDLSSGTYYIHAVTDNQSQVYEHNGEANNRAASQAITVTALPELAPTDLQIGSLVAPVSGNSGQTVDLGWKVTNGGQTPTQSSSWTDAVYLSDDAELNPANDALLGTRYHYGTLRPGEGYSPTLSVQLPDGIEGSYMLFFATDVNHSVPDIDRTNNSAAYAAPIAITLSPAPDLEITAVAPSSSAYSGQPLKVQWKVTNSGAASADRPWYDAIYLSIDSELSASDIRLDSSYASGSMAVSANYQKSVDVWIPSNASGSYYILLKADSRDEIYEHGEESNNLTSWPITLTVPPPADLIVDQVSGPVTASPGSAINVQWRVTNTGQWVASGSLCDAIFVSADPVWDNNDPKLGNHCYSINLPAGGNALNKAQMIVPDRLVLDGESNVSVKLPGVTPGAYYVIVRADIMNAIPETNDANNIGVSTATTAVDVNLLQLGVAAEGTISANEGRFYRVDVPAGETLLVALDSQSTTAANEVYVRYGQTPSRGAFDYMFTDPFKADQDVVVPLTEAGSYYIYLYAADGETQNFTIKASLMFFELRDFYPTQGGQGGQVTVTIRGAKMTPNTLAWLESGAVKVPAKNFSWVSASQAYATFDLTGVAMGSYNLVISENNAKSIGTKPFEVVRAIPGVLKVSLDFPQNIRLGQTGIFTIRYYNDGNTDVISPVLKIEGENTEVRLLRDASFTGSTLKIFALNALGPVGIFPPGSAGQTEMAFRPIVSSGTVKVRVYKQGLTSIPHNKALQTTQTGLAVTLPDLTSPTESASQTPESATFQPVDLPLSGEMLLNETYADTTKIWDILQKHQSPLVNYEATVFGETVRADTVIMMASMNPDWEVNPALLLAYLQWKYNLLEQSDLTAAEIDQMVTITDQAQPGLYWQLVWLSEQMIKGYAAQPENPSLAAQQLSSRLAAISEDANAAEALSRVYENLFGPTDLEMDVSIDWRPVFRPPLNGELRVNSFFDANGSDGTNITRFDGRTLSTKPLTIGYNSYENHFGYDFATSDTQTVAVYASAAGKITYADKEGCTFNGQSRTNYVVTIEHTNGLKTQYRHIDGIINNPRLNRPWKAGDEVLQGDIVGHISPQSYKTQCSTGPHLDYRVKKATGADQWFDVFGWWGDANTQGRQPLFNATTTVSELGQGFQRFGLGDWPKANEGDGGQSYYVRSRSNLSNNKPDYRNWAIWWANIPTDGEYDVQVYVPKNAEASNVEYRLMTQDGISRVMMNQVDYQGQWMSLGKFNFKEGGQAAVILTDYIANTNGKKIFFDTVRWIAPGEEDWEPGDEMQADAEGQSVIIGSSDPNDILGPEGYGDAHWIPAANRIGYTIRFENDPVLATAPAQKVVIEQTLDETLDARKFRLGAFGFGGQIYQQSEGKPFYQGRVGPVEVSGVSLYVDVNAGIDVTTGKAFWIFQTIDPATGSAPSDPLVGFLPPDINDGEGQGFVSYSIQAVTDATTGTRVDAMASIVFDNNAPIETPPIFNTLDAVAPASQLEALPEQTVGDQILLTWTGEDDPNGSGLKDYQLYVSEDDGPFSMVSERITDTSYVYTGKLGHTYGFFVTARDHAGNFEAAKSAPETSTLIYVENVPSNISLNSTNASLTADGSSTSVITATVVDGLGNPQAGVVVQFSTTLGSLNPVNAKTDARGEAKAVLTASNNWGLARVTALVGKLAANVDVDMNDLPTPAPDFYDGMEDQTLIVAEPGVLENDTDQYGSSLTVTLVDAPEEGTLTLDPNGSFTYEPAANSSGTITFTYRINDGFADSVPAEVTIHLAAVNDSPVAVDDGLVLKAGSAPNIIPVLANDLTGSDTGETLTVSSVGQAAHGVVAISDDSQHITYTPAGGYMGEDNFTYTISDGSDGQDTATVFVTIVSAQSVIAIVEPGKDTTIHYTGSQDETTTVQAPADDSLNDVTLVYTPLTNVTAPDDLAFTNHAFELQAYRMGRIVPDFSFVKPVQVVIHYTDEGMKLIDEASLEVMQWNNGQWASEMVAILDGTANTVRFQTVETGRYALFGATKNMQLFLPMTIKP